MQYVGNLYGKRGRKYFPLELTSADVDEMINILVMIRSGLKPYRDESGVREVSLHCFPLLEPIIEKAKGKPWSEIKAIVAK